MVVDLWCHPNMSPQLTAGLRNTVEQFTQYRAREVWGLRVSPWKLHALKNSHIFRRWDDPANVPEGTEMPSLHTVEKRLGVSYLFPDETDRPSWDTLPVRNVTNLAKEYMVKIRGSQAQLTAAMTEIEVCRCPNFILGQFTHIIIGPDAPSSSSSGSRSNHIPQRPPVHASSQTSSSSRRRCRYQGT